MRSKSRSEKHDKEFLDTKFGIDKIEMNEEISYELSGLDVENGCLEKQLAFSSLPCFNEG